MSGFNKIDSLFFNRPEWYQKTIVKMVCSICRQGDHRATTCNSDILQQSVARIKAYWLGENMPEGWTDELVKNWATTDPDVGYPYWRRIWRLLQGEWTNRGWWRTTMAEREENPVLSFLSPEPRSVWAFRERIRNYVRPAVIPEPRRRQHPHPVPLPPQAAEAAGAGGGIIAPPDDLDLDAEVRLLHRHMEDALVRHRHRIIHRLQEQNKRLNKKKIGLVMDAPDEMNYFDPVCAICMNEVTEQTVLSFGCKHTFCGNCAIKTIQKTTGGCPTCRVNISEIHFKPTTDRETFNKLSTHISFS